MKNYKIVFTEAESQVAAGPELDAAKELRNEATLEKKPVGRTPSINNRDIFPADEHEQEEEVDEVIVKESIQELVEEARVDYNKYKYIMSLDESEFDTYINAQTDDEIEDITIMLESEDFATFVNEIDNATVALTESYGEEDYFESILTESYNAYLLENAPTANTEVKKPSALKTAGAVGAAAGAAGIGAGIGALKGTGAKAAIVNGIRSAGGVGGLIGAGAGLAAAAGYHAYKRVKDTTASRRAAANKLLASKGYVGNKEIEAYSYGKRGAITAAVADKKAEHIDNIRNAKSKKDIIDAKKADYSKIKDKNGNERDATSAEIKANRKNAIATAKANRKKAIATAKANRKAEIKQVKQDAAASFAKGKLKTKAALARNGIGFGGFGRSNKTMKAFAAGDGTKAGWSGGNVEYSGAKGYTNLREDYSDLDLMLMLDEAGYVADVENLEILKEGLETGEYFIESEQCAAGPELEAAHELKNEATLDKEPVEDDLEKDNKDIYCDDCHDQVEDVEGIEIKESYSDLDLMYMLDEAGYAADIENLSILKEDAELQEGLIRWFKGKYKEYKARDKERKELKRQNKDTKDRNEAREKAKILARQNGKAEYEYTDANGNKQIGKVADKDDLENLIKKSDIRKQVHNAGINARAKFYEKESTDLFSKDSDSIRDARKADKLLDKAENIKNHLKESYSDLELMNILDESGYTADIENLKILKEGLETGKFIIE